MSKYEVLIGDCIEQLKTLEDESVNCVVTSPPYYGLRDYGTGKWVGGEPDCEHEGHVLGNNRNFVDREGRGSNAKALTAGTCTKCGAVKEDAQIGLEDTPEAYISNLVNVFREVRRVLKPDGTVWLNLGDSYWGGKGKSGARSPEKYATDYGTGRLNKAHHAAGAGTGKTRPTDRKHSVFKPKDLMMIPHRVAIALQEDGWWVRQDIVWTKPNPMPESVKDRCTKAHEYFFLLAKEQVYYFDHKAIQEQVASSTVARERRGVSANHKNTDGAPGQAVHTFTKARDKDPTREVSTLRNKRTVWEEKSSTKFGSKHEELIHRGGMHQERGEGLIAYRPNEPAQEAFVALLRENLKKKEAYASLSPGIKKTTIDHWYRNDQWFSLPSIDDWELVRELLKDAEGFDVIDEQMTDIQFKSDEIANVDEGKRKKRSVWNVSLRAFKGAHFATYPPELIEPCILAGCPEGGTVLDIFAGSGTTGGVAIKNQRNAVLIELNPEYAALIPKRIEAIMGFKVAEGEEAPNVHNDFGSWFD
jgi:site-specific DNA-methyltransferase (adenine-specific)